MIGPGRLFSLLAARLARSSRIRVLKIYDVCSQKSAISFVDEVIRRLPFRVLVIQPDNGAELSR